MLYDAVWALAKNLDELSTMKPLVVESVNCERGRQNTDGKRSAEEVFKKMLEVRMYLIKLLQEITRLTYVVLFNLLRKLDT